MEQLHLFVQCAGGENTKTTPPMLHSDKLQHRQRGQRRRLCCLSALLAPFAVGDGKKYEKSMLTI